MNWRNSCGDDAFVMAGLAAFVSDIGSSTAVRSFTSIPNHRERLAAFAAAVPCRVPAAVPSRVPDHLAATTTFAASRTYPGIVSAIGPSFRQYLDLNRCSLSDDGCDELSTFTHLKVLNLDQDLLTNVDNNATHSSKRSPSSPPRGSPPPPFPHLRVRGSPPPPSKDTCHGCLVGFAIVVAAGVAAGAIIAGVYFASRELSALLRSLKECADAWVRMGCPLVKKVYIGPHFSIRSFTGIPNHRERLAAFAAAVPRRVPAAVPGRVPDHLAATTTFAASRTYPGIVSAIGPSFRCSVDVCLGDYLGVKDSWMSSLQGSSLLSIHLSDIADLGLAQPKNCSNLISLTVCSNLISLRGMQCNCIIFGSNFNSCFAAVWQYLDLNRCSLSDDVCDELSTFTHLKVLNLGLYDITDTYLLHLKGLTRSVIEDQDLLTNVDNDATHSSKRSPSLPPRGSPPPPFPHLRVRGSPPPPSNDTCHGCLVGFAIVVAAGVAAGAIIAGVYFASRELSALLRSLKECDDAWGAFGDKQEDRISLLSDDLLSEIILRLDVIEAVRTRILSTCLNSFSSTMVKRSRPHKLRFTKVVRGPVGNEPRAAKSSAAARHHAHLKHIEFEGFRGTRNDIELASYMLI
ncbi:hypothetical protein ACH5RR_020770 [Cinchona calisaya]|uniref:Uncharacterized protein n=1 Tax=Cinchona calisaya TaxID=153742 RepID=A0ABD2ZFD9_9GENT